MNTRPEGAWITVRLDGAGGDSAGGAMIVLPGDPGGWNHWEGRIPHLDQQGPPNPADTTPGCASVEHTLCGRQGLPVSRDARGNNRGRQYQDDPGYHCVPVGRARRFVPRRRN
jgi:hypothetical protein